MSELVFCNPFMRDSLILIESEVVEVIRAFRQHSDNSYEAGGLLLGYRRFPHIHVSYLTTPQSRDARNRYKFHRKDLKHQELTERLWNSSGKKIDYLGEWHTHPEIRPTPSPVDLGEWARISKERKSALVFVIASSSEYDSFYCALQGTILPLSAE